MTEAVTEAVTEAGGHAGGAGRLCAQDARPVASDDALMEAYAGGDAAAFEQLYRRHRGVVYRFFLRQLPASEAEDCHQDVWLRIVRSRARYHSDGRFTAFLFTIAHRVLIDRHRRRLRIVADDGVDPDEVAVADGDTLDRSRQLHRLHALIRALPLAQREALLLHEEAGFSLKEIATITNGTEEGVKSRLRYALQKLRAGMQQESTHV